MQETDFKIHQSARHARFLGVLIFLAVLAVLAANLSWVLKLGLVLLVVYFGARVYQREVRLGGPLSLLGLSRQEDGWWQVTTPQGAYLAKIDKSVMITPAFSVLSFKADNGLRLKGMVFPDSFPPGQYRRFMTNF